MPDTDTDMREVSAKDGSSFQVAAADLSDWTTITHEENRRDGDLYTIWANDDPHPIGSLQYLKGFPEPMTLTIRDIGVRPEYQRRGVATALLEKLRADWPEYKVDPGVTTEMGLRFTRHILATEPEGPIALARTYEGKTVGY